MEDAYTQVSTILGAVAANSAARIPHLGDRPAALEVLGWRGRDAAWIALVCLHSGTFTRPQYAAFIGTDNPAPASRLVAALRDQKWAAEKSWEDVGLGQSPAGDRRSRLCRIGSREVYRALGVENIRHRRAADPALLLRRLLSLDYVVDHAAEPWLPTEAEKVAAFEELGIESDVLPRRDYHGAGGGQRRFFPAKFPVALGDDAAMFVYPDAGDVTASGLSTWGLSHAPLWAALRERGREVRVVVAAREHRQLTRGERVLKRWRTRGGGNMAQMRAETERLYAAISTVDREVLAEYCGGLTEDGKLAGPVNPAVDRFHDLKTVLDGKIGTLVAEHRRIEEAIAEVDSAVLAKYGDVNGALKRLDELDDILKSAGGGGWIDTGTTWWSRRLCGR